MKSKLKAPGTKRLKLKYDVLLSSFAFSFNLRRYTQDEIVTALVEQGLTAVTSAVFSTPSIVVTSITDANFRDAIEECLLLSPADGVCPTSEYGAMQDWNVALVTNMAGAFNGRAVQVDPRLNPG